MAKKTTIVTTSKDGLKTKEIVKNTGAKTSRQKVKSEKISAKKSMSDNARKATTTVAIAGEIGNTERTKAREKTKQEQAKYNAYGQALAKWNGILKSTPDAADGTNVGQEGSNGLNNNDTGTNPDIIWG